VFYFQQLFQTAMNGIDSSNVTSAVLGVAGSILLLSFLYSAYEAFAAGGDVRMLGIAGIKYLIIGLAFANYGTVFRDVNQMFNSVANFIFNSSGGDVFSDWLNQLAQYWQTNGNTSLWNLVTGTASGIISLILIGLAFVIFPFSYLIFTVFYAMYGSVLYVTGPFVLALLPSRGLGQLSRAYLVNLLTFQAWGLIYAIIQVLMSAVNLNSINSVLNANGVLNSFVGSSQMMLLAMTACLFSLSIALIPFIASRIVRGDVGGTMLTMVSAVTTAGSAAAATMVGASEGIAAGQAAAGGAAPAAPSASAAPSLGSPMPPSAPSGGTSGIGYAASLAASSTAPLSGRELAAASAMAELGGSPSPISSSNEPAPSPAAAAHSQPRSRPGVFRGYNVAHAIAWHVGHSVGKRL
jgi:hypothetical protein